MSIGYCPTCQASPIIGDDYCPTCHRTGKMAQWVKSLPEYKPDAFGTRLSAEGVNRLGDTIADLRMEVARLRTIEAAAVAAVDFDQWQGDEWYELMMALQKALTDSTEK